MTQHVTRPIRIVTKQQGFTSLELMVVVAIVGVMAALGVTNFGVWQSRADLKEAVTEVQNELALARMAAISRNIPVAVNIAVVPKSITVTTTNANNGAVLSTTYHPIAHVTSVFNLTAVGPPPIFTATPAAAVMFNSMGFRLGGAIAGAGGSENQVIAISNDRGLQYTMRVTSRGGVTWCPSTTCQGTH